MTEPGEDQVAICDMTRYFIRKEVALFAVDGDKAAKILQAAVRKAGAPDLFHCHSAAWQPRVAERPSRRVFFRAARVFQ